MDIEFTKLSSPSVFLVRMVVFLVLCALVGVVLYKQIIQAFFANPGLNALIGAVLFIGIILAFRQVIRLYPEVSWVNNFRIADPGLAPARHPRLLAPMAAILGGERSADARTGRDIEFEAAPGIELCRAYSVQGDFIGVLKRAGGPRWHPEKVVPGA